MDSPPANIDVLNIHPSEDDYQDLLETNNRISTPSLASAYVQTLLNQSLSPIPSTSRGASNNYPRPRTTSPPPSLPPRARILTPPPRPSSSNPAPTHSISNILSDHSAFQPINLSRANHLPQHPEQPQTHQPVDLELTINIQIQTSNHVQPITNVAVPYTTRAFKNRNCFLGYLKTQIFEQILKVEPFKVMNQHNMQFSLITPTITYGAEVLLSPYPQPTTYTSPVFNETPPPTPFFVPHPQNPNVKQAIMYATVPFIISTKKAPQPEKPKTEEVATQVEDMHFTNTLLDYVRSNLHKWATCVPTTQNDLFAHRYIGITPNPVHVAAHPTSIALRPIRAKRTLLEDPSDSLNPSMQARLGPTRYRGRPRLAPYFPPMV